MNRAKQTLLFFVVALALTPLFGAGCGHPQDPAEMMALKKQTQAQAVEIAALKKQVGVLSFDVGFSSWSLSNRVASLERANSTTTPFIEPLNEWERTVRRYDQSFGDLTETNDPRHGLSVADRVFDALIASSARTNRDPARLLVTAQEVYTLEALRERAASLHAFATNLDARISRIENAEAIQHQIADIEIKAIASISRDESAPQTSGMNELSEKLDMLRSSIDDLGLQQSDANMLIEYQMLFPPPRAWRRFP